ncbi:MAG: hypothetical protein RIS94_455, partial [Pseudomonadota bacterium]
MGAYTPPEDTCPLTSVVAHGPRYTVAEIEAALPKGKGKTACVRYTTVPLVPEHLPFADDTAARMTQAHPKLWAGDWSAIRGIGKEQLYPSQSEADIALARYIARHLVERGAPVEMLSRLTEAVFDRSGLSQRNKWQEREDYRATTIGRACASALPPISSRPSGTGPVDWSLHGDVRNARFFADKWKNTLAYVHERKRWMQWQSSRWAMCMAGEDVERAKETCQALYKAAGDELANDPEKAQKLVREAAQAHLSQRIKAMIDLAQSDPMLAISSSRLDADNYVLGVGNGVVDLRKATLSANEPGRYITRHCNADYDPKALCPRWLRFLDEVFQGDQATITSVQRLLGYSLTGLSTEEFLIFCVGFGANGKSIFGNVVADIVGDYAKTAPSTLLAARRADDHGPRSDLAMLDGLRIASINELPAGMHLDEQMVKQLAGREPISARPLYGEYFTFKPRFTTWVRTNHKPIVRGDDDVGQLPERRFGRQRLVVEDVQRGAG